MRQQKKTATSLITKQLIKKEEKIFRSFTFIMQRHFLPTKPLVGGVFSLPKFFLCAVAAATIIFISLCHRICVYSLMGFFFLCYYTHELNE